MVRVRQNQRTASFCCFLQKMISQENTVGVKKNRVAKIVSHARKMRYEAGYMVVQNQTSEQPI